MKRLLHLAALLIVVAMTAALLTSCKQADSDESGSTASTASTKNLSELMSMGYEEMSEADVDRLNLLTGSMSPEDYEAKYGENSIFAPAQSGDKVQSQGIIDDITGAIWGSWTKVDIPGAICSNGSQYKIFVMKSKGFWNWLYGYTKNLLIYLEPGGACWDYPSCTGQTGVRGAANPNGIPDNFMNLGDYLDPNVEGGSVNAVISPLVLNNHPTGQNVQTSRWNKVFIPYCTGDVHSGNNTKIYDDPTGENPPITYHHVGATNIEKVIAYLQGEFSNIKKLMVTGSSAGGVGSLTNYHFFKEALGPDESFLLNDSGPIFSATETEGNQYLLHQKIKQEWNLDYILNKYLAAMPGFDYDGDFGQINEALSYYHPNDKLATTLFKRDANYSMYSYARFFDLDENIPEEKEQVLQLWADDIDRMILQYDALDNFSYFIPYFRDMNESHCTTIVEFTGTEYLDSGINAGDFIEDILDGGSVTSYHEPDNPSDADVTNFWMALVNLLL
ncbi:MAG: pectinacetylesterase family protein [Proteobacteria bacterium]|nr:pectinacetylesterase family protein [Pseudomonadota bacterium]